MLTALAHLVQYATEIRIEKLDHLVYPNSILLKQNDDNNVNYRKCKTDRRKRLKHELFWI